jgi:hypothetical protein
MMVNCFPNIFLSAFINYLNSNNFPVMSIFFVAIVLCLMALPFVQETYGIKPKELIDELSNPETLYE